MRLGLGLGLDKSINDESFSQEAQDYFSKLTTQPSTTHKTLMDNYLFKPLVLAGIFNEIDRLFVYATEVESNGLVSLVNPTSTICSLVSGPSWVQNQGYTGNGATNYINTNYNLSTSSVKYTQNSASCGVYLRKELNVNTVEMGASSSGTGPDGILLQARVTNLIYGSLNSTFSSFANTSSLGLTSLNRVNSTGFDIIKNGVTLSTKVIGSNALISKNVYVLAWNQSSAANFSTNQASIVFLGSGNINHTTLSTILNGYMTALGTNVY